MLKLTILFLFAASAFAGPKRRDLALTKVFENYVQTMQAGDAPRRAPMQDYTFYKKGATVIIKSPKVTAGFNKGAVDSVSASHDFYFQKFGVKGNNVKVTLSLKSGSLESADATITAKDKSIHKGSVKVSFDSAQFEITIVHTGSINIKRVTALWVNGLKTEWSGLDGKALLDGNTKKGEEDIVKDFISNDVKNWWRNDIYNQYDNIAEALKVN